MFALECACVWLEVSGKTSFISEATRLKCTLLLENIRTTLLTLTAEKSQWTSSDIVNKDVNG